MSTRYILCSKCSQRMQLHPEDERMGFKQRRVEIPGVKTPPGLARQVTTYGDDGHVSVERTELTSLVCDGCNDPVPDGTPVTAVTLYRGPEPEPWEEAYGQVRTPNKAK